MCGGSGHMWRRSQQKGWPFLGQKSELPQADSSAAQEQQPGVVESEEMDLELAVDPV